jgi:hypothetical protein
MQLKDVSIIPILEYLSERQGEWSFYSSVVELFPREVPEKLIRLKLYKMIKQGYSGGCGCGCRGDYEITDKCLALIGRERTKKYSGY